MGHVRDLPKARLSVDIKNDFAPKYDIIKGKEKLVKDLKKLAADSDSVYLATDPDREGEAISWHLAYILGLPEDYMQRVEFNEITKSGVENGMLSRQDVALTDWWVTSSARLSRKRSAEVYRLAACSLSH